MPGCSRLADHSHHIWRRSFVIGDKPWVRLWDGTIVGNLTGLCWLHHQEVTENKADIVWIGIAYAWRKHGHIVSVELGEEPPDFMLDPQPPPYGNIVPSDTSQNISGRHEHVGPGAVEKCVTCKRALPRPQSPREGKRPRKAWTITVPVDERENGADVLDTLLDECAKLFGHDETKALRYFTLAQALALVVQHGEKMVGDA